MTMPDGARYYEGTRVSIPSHGTQVKVVGVNKENFEWERPLPHIERHSPDGFEWGYGGSGPADLALSMLAHASGSEEFALSQCRYQEFKMSVIAQLSHHAKSWRLPCALVNAWVELKMQFDIDTE